MESARTSSSFTPAASSRPRQRSSLQKIPANPAYGTADALFSTSSSSNMNASASSPTATRRDGESSAGGGGWAADDTRPLSDVEILSSVPPSLIRLLSILAPFISLLVYIVRLASWTAGPHSASASILLLIAWWAACTYTYPIVRYAPQLIPLAVSAWYYLKMHSSPLRKSTTASSGGEAGSALKGINGRVIGGSSITLSPSSLADEERELTVHNSASISQTLAEIEELADFFSNMFTYVLRPLKSLLDWSDPSTTLATLSFLLVTYPLYLLCFLPWEQLGLPKFGVVFLPGRGGLLALAWNGAVRSIQFSAHLAGRGLFGLRQFLETKELGQALLVHLDHFFDTLARQWAVIQPHAGRGLAFSTSLSQRTLSLLRVRSPSSATSSSSAVIIPLLPPYPLFSLTTSSLLLWIGTLVLTWTSPFAALLRHALWRSALVRYLSRKGLQLLTLGHWSYVDADGNDKMRHYSLLGSFAQTSHVAPTQIYGKLGHDPFEISAEPLPAPQIVRKSDEEGGAEGTAEEKALEERKVERHEDVVYQFSIYENQRWWVGLDWTAALLPQERPSWADEHNNPVSPPPSFSLPPAKLTLTPTPTKASPQAHMRRLVKWQWIDPEWTVAGAGFITAAEGSSTALTAAGGNSAGLSAAASLASNLSESLRGRFTAQAPGSPSSPTNALMAPSTLAGSEMTKEESLDVDADGWQYGDNAWEKMSKKSGMGRYTRRRKWVRRAVLVEVVERGYVPPENEPEPRKEQ